MNDFKQDNEYSLDPEDDKIINECYMKMFPTIEKIEFCKDLEEQFNGNDKIFHFKNGNWLSIDEKKRREDYGDILLEIWSNVETKRRGWLYTCQCDYISYIVMPTRKIHFIPSMLLKKAWVTNQNKWIRYKPILAYNEGYTTESRGIKHSELMQAITREMVHSFSNTIVESEVMPNVNHELR